MTNGISLCSSPPTNLWQAGLMPERLADWPCLIHCHKRHIVYKTERHCNTNTNTPRVGDTLGKPLDFGSSVSLKEGIAIRSLLQRLIEMCVLYSVLLLYKYTCIHMHLVHTMCIHAFRDV